VILDPSGSARRRRRQMSRVTAGPAERDGLVRPTTWVVFRSRTSRTRRSGSHQLTASLLRPNRFLDGCRSAEPLNHRCTAGPWHALTLAHWSRNNWDKDEHGTRFTLLDPTGKRVMLTCRRTIGARRRRKAQDVSEPASRRRSRRAAPEFRSGSGSASASVTLSKDAKGVWRVSRPKGNPSPTSLPRPKPCQTPGPSDR
jgi:hypothetical protein